MSNPSVRPDVVRQSGRFVGRFAHQLSVRSGTQVGFRWNPAQSVSNSTTAWQIAWADGPGVLLMQYFASGLAGSVAGVDVANLQWCRTVSTQAVGLAMIRNVRDGLPPLGSHPDCDSLRRELEALDYPERGVAGDIEVAARLTRLSNELERDMAGLLARHGLAGLGEVSMTAREQVTELQRLQDAQRKHA